jgi:hypothetical protein
MKRRLTAVLFLLTATGGALLAQVPPANAIPNWSVQPTWSPVHGSEGLQTMTDISGGLPFIPIQPCRIADTRGNGFSGTQGPPALAANVTRTFNISGSPSGVPAPPNGCAADAIPEDAKAVSVQFTIVAPSSDGNLIAWAGGTVPQVSVLNWPAGTGALGNGTIVPLEDVYFYSRVSVRPNMPAGQSAHLVIDVNGYFTSVLRSGSRLLVQSVITSGHVAFFNSFNGDSVVTSGALGRSVSSGHGSAGIEGVSESFAGYTFGGKFQTRSTGYESAGVKGISGNGDPLGDTLNCGPCYTAGVRGVDNGNIPNFGRGVMGVSRNAGVHGVLLAASGTGVQTDAYLAYFNGSPWAGYFFGNTHVADTFTASTKSFVQPHPTDPAKEVRYVSLEGPQADVYLRGTTQVSRGVTRIPIPEHFRFVADPATYSTLVTPVGRMATVAVLSEDETGIVVEASRDVKIHYVVYAERSAVKVGDPITENIHIRPGSESDHVAHLPESYRRLMIQNGTLKEDGSVNRETAERLGWSLAGEDRRAEKRAEEAGRN